MAVFAVHALCEVRPAAAGFRSDPPHNAQDVRRYAGSLAADPRVPDASFGLRAVVAPIRVRKRLTVPYKSADLEAVPVAPL